MALEEMVDLIEDGIADVAASFDRLFIGRRPDDFVVVVALYFKGEGPFASAFSMDDGRLDLVELAAAVAVVDEAA